MGDVIRLFPQRHCRGTIHVFHLEDGSFEIGHESASGDSWGHFQTFASLSEAVEAAHRLSAAEMGGECEVYVRPDAGGAA